MKMLHWASRFSIFCFLDNSNYNQKHHSVECILGAGATRSVLLQGKHAFDSLQEFYDTKPGWLFGHFGFGLTKEVEKETANQFDPGFFFEPEILIRIQGVKILIEVKNDSRNSSDIFDAINAQAILKSETASVNIESRLDEGEYIDIINKLKSHIQRGDCYEINFCQEFFADAVLLDPITVFTKLHDISPNPFSAFYRVHDNYCLCASPERFLQKQGRQLISQPIKGTSQRSTEAGTDAKNKEYLLTSEKERSENVMIVDLVRNDLSKVCEEGSVVVEEMFGIYSFPQVYQMISTIKGLLADDASFTRAIEATFPVGSMTGAPKKKVLELIERYETGPRGLFSGSIGYIDPETNFDFNVVIRSIFYNSETKNLSYWAGGGITFHSDPESEFAECLAKVEAIKKALS